MRKITLCNPSLDSLVFSKKGERILSLIPLTAIPAVEQSMFAFSNKFMNNTPTNNVVTSVTTNTPFVFNNPLMDTMKNDSLTTNFVKKRLTRLAALAAMMLLSVQVVFGQAPTIASFSPTSGIVGSSVTITGTNFSSTQTNNVVYFGSTKATVTSASATQLVVTVPKSSTHSPISVAVAGKIALTKSAFRTTNPPIAARPVQGSNFGNNILFSSLGGSQNNDVIISAGDFNNDGLADVVKAGNSSVRVHLNAMSSAGTITTSSLSSGSDFSISGTVNSLTVGDMNADGMLDIITSSYSGVSVLINTTSGGVLSFASSLNISGGFTAVRVSDFNLDGLIDIASLTSSGVNIYTNTTSNGTVSFSAATTVSLSGFDGLDVGDLNGDGKYDFVVTKGGETDVIVNNSTSGTLSFATPFSLAYGDSKVVVVDLDADGDSDLFVRTKLVSNNFVSGTLQASDFTDFAKPYNIDHDLGFSVTDFNSDGYPEIIAGSSWDKMYVYTNSAQNTISSSSFNGRWYPRQDLYCGACGTGIGVDIDGDNKVDAVSSYRNQSYFTVTQNIMSPLGVLANPTTLSSFVTCQGTASATQTTSVSGSGLSANMVLTAPSGFQISTSSSSGYASTLTLTQSGGNVNATTIYVRLSAATLVGTYNGNLTIASSGQTTLNIALTGTVNAARTISLTAGLKPCAGQTNGSLTVTTAGGTAPISNYVWTRSSTQTGTYTVVSPTPNSNSNPTNLGVGWYKLAITDACGTVTSAAVQLSTGTPVAINSSSVTMTGCNAGTVTVLVQGGGGTTKTAVLTSATDTLSATPSSSAAGVFTITFTNVPLGTYTVTAYDQSSGCLTTAANQVVVETVTISSVTNSLTNCNPIQSQAQVNVSGGGTSYTYQWYSGTQATGTVLSTSNTLNNAAVGDYTIKVTDNINCIAIETVTINAPDPVAPDAATSDATCSNSADGSVQASPGGFDLTTGGNGVYTYAWTASNGGAIPSGQDTLANLSSLTPGTYTVTVSDGIGCSGSNSFTISAPAALAVSETITDLSCFESADGAIAITATGGNTPYAFSWVESATSTGTYTAYSTNEDLTGMSIGYYKVTVTDANLCTFTSAAFQVEQPIQVLASIATTTTDPVCQDATAPTLTFTGQNGTAPYTFYYSINDGSTTTIDSVTTANASTDDVTITIPTSTGGSFIYTLTNATDSYGCLESISGQTATFVVNELPTVNNPSDITACGNATVSAIAFTSPNNLATSYQWTNDNTAIGLSAASGTADNSNNFEIPTFTATNALTAQQATITVTPYYTSGGTTCAGANETILISVNPIPVIDDNTATICSGELFSYTPANEGGSNSADMVPVGTQYTWTVSANLNLDATDEVSPDTTIAQTITNTTNVSQQVTYTITPQVGSCSGNSFDVVVTVNPEPTIADTSRIICSGETFSFTPFNNGGVNGDDIVPAGTTYTWIVQDNPNVGGDDDRITDTTVIAQTLTNTSGADESVTFLVTPFTGDCYGSPFNISVTVHPEPVATSHSVTVCNEEVLQINLHDDISGGSIDNFDLSINSNGLSASAGNPTDGNYSSLSEVADDAWTNTTNDTVDVVYTVTPYSIDGCQGEDYTFTVTVTPKPTMDALTNITVCDGETVAATTLTSQVTGVVLDWTSSNTTVGLSATSGTTTIPSFTATNATGSPIMDTITVTPSIVVNGNLTCSETSETFTITVNPLPVGGASTETTCSNVGFSYSPQPYISNGVASTFTWEITNITDTISGVQIGDTGSAYIVDTAINTTAAPVDIEYTVTPISDLKTFNYTLYSTHDGNWDNTNYTDIAQTSADFDAILDTNFSTTTIVQSGNASASSLLNFTDGVELVNIGMQIPNNSNFYGFDANGTFVPAETGVYTFQTYADDAVELSINGTVVSIASNNFDQGTISLVAGTAYPMRVRFQEFAGGDAMFVKWQRPSQSSFSYQADEIPGESGCAGIPFTVTVSVTPEPVGIPDTIETCSNVALNYTLDDTNISNGQTNITFNWWAPANPNISGSSNNGSGSLTNTLVNTSGVDQTIDYQIYPTGDCDGQMFIVKVIVHSEPVVTTNLFDTICSGEAFDVTAAVIEDNSMTGLTYTWVIDTNLNVTGQAIEATPQDSITQTLTNPTGIQQNVVYTVTPISPDGCEGDSFTVTITVNPLPVGADTTFVVCSKEAFSFDPQDNVNDATHGNNVSSTFTWVVSSASGVTGVTQGDTGVGNVVSDSITNITSSPVAVVYTVTPTSNPEGCDGPTFTITVVVNPQPVGIDSTYEVCSNVQINIPLNDDDIDNALTNNTFTYTVVDNPDVTGESGSGNTNVSTITQTLENTSSQDQEVVFTVTPVSSDNCVGEPFTITVTVKPEPVIGAKIAQVCSDVPVNFDLDTLQAGAGDTYTYTVSNNTQPDRTTASADSILDINNNVGNTNDSYQYLITPFGANGCVGADFTLTTIVRPEPVVGDQTLTVCSDDSLAVSFDASTSVAATTYNVTALNLGGLTVSGGNAAIADSLFAINLSNDQFLNDSTTGVLVTYDVYPVSSFGCKGDMFNVFATINPEPVGNNSTDTICSNFAFSYDPQDNINAVNSVTSTFTWEITAVTGTVSGVALGDNGNGLVAETIENTSATAAIVEFTVTPTSDPDGCEGTPFTITLTVNPQPIAADFSYTVCSDESFTYDPQDNVDDNTDGNSVTSSFAWEVTAITGGAVSNASIGDQDTSNIIGSIHNVSGDVSYVEYTVTPTSTDGCAGNDFLVTVQVNPEPAINNLSEIICTNGTFSIDPQDGQDGEIPANTTYKWTVSAGAVTGASDQASYVAGPISQNLENATNAPIDVVYTVTPISADSCVGTDFTITVTVSPTITIASMTAEVCSGVPFLVTPVDGASGNVVPNNTWYEWTVQANNNVTGETASNNTNSNISQTLVNTSTTSQFVTYIVTPYFQLNGGPLCSGDTFTVVVKVLTGSPSVNVGVDDTTCANVAASVTATTIDAIFGSWSTQGTGSITPNISSTTISYLPSQADVTTGYVDLTYTATNGCGSNTDVVRIVINALPTVNAGTDQTICNGDDVTLTATSTSNISWLGGISDGVAFNPTATTTYTVQATDNNGCVNTDEVTVTVRPLPNTLITTTGATTICAGGSVTMLATIAPVGATYTYQWNDSNGPINGANSNSYTASTSEAYTVTITDNNGCTATTASPTTVTIASSIVVAVNSESVCYGDTVALVATGATTYLWSNGSTNDTIFVSPTSNTSYSVTGTSAGCTAAAVSNVTVNQLPTVAAITGATNICEGGETQFASATTGGTWSSSDNSVATVDASGIITGVSAGTATITYEVTNNNGCAASQSAVINVNAGVTASISTTTATTFCQGGSVVLTASAGSSYLWSNGAQTQAITVDASGSFYVTVTSASGCSATSTATAVTVNPLPVVAAGNDATICTGSSTSLVASGAATYVWSPSTGLSATNTASVTANPTATTTYTVTGTDANGCVNTDQVVVTVSPLPTASITASAATICVGASTTLTANGGTGFTYLWSNGATTQAITVSPSATTTYTVSLTNATGCTSASAASQVITVNPLPVATINASATAVCVGTSATLTASAGSSYLWSTGATTAAITVTPTSTTSYSVTVTNANGCSATSAVTTIGVNPLPVVAAISGPNNVCAGLSITLTNATAGGTWSTSNSALATVNPTTGYVTGVAQGAVTLTYTVTNSNGCVNSSSTVVNVGIGLTAMVPLTGNNTICSGTNTQLSHVLPGGIWYSSNPTVAVVSNTGLVTGVSAGTSIITYEITNAAGCASAVNLTMTINAQPTAAIATSGATTFCQGGSVTLTASPGASHLWNTGETTASISVASSGNYQVVITGANGCTTAAVPQAVVVNPIPMVLVTPSSSTTFCQGGSVILTSTPGASYLWSNGETTQSITVTTTGNYTVAMTNSLGCSATSTIMPVSVGTIPAATVTASAPTTLCQGGTVTLTAGYGVSYLWSNGAITQSIVVSTAGSYTVTVTNSFGCSATSAPTTVTVNPLPVATITPSGPTTFCQGGNVILTATSGTTYLWSNGATTQSITVNQSGNYSVTVSNANACVSTSNAVTVTVNALPLAAISNVGPTTFCQGGSVILIATPGTSYLWSGNNATTQSNTITTSGNYTVTVMNAAGCTATSAPTTVTVNPTPVATITPSGPTTFCQGGNVVLTAGPATGVTYLWSNGLTTPTITVNTTGNYSVVVTSSAGCSATATAVPVTVNALPLAAISTIGATTFCQGGSVTLMATPGTSYLWSGNNATTQSNTITTAGSYTVTVMNAAGCTVTSAPVAVTVNALPAVPVVVASGPTAICPSGSVTLTAPAGFTAYSWNNGATSPSITVNIAGNYKVTITNANGCSATSALTVVTVGDNTAPVIITPADITLNLATGCSVSNLNLGTPVVTDNCLIAYVSNNAPYTFPIGTTVVTWTALDASGNVTTANQTITIVDTIAPVISVPATVTVAANNGCDATGVFIGDATATDNCTTTTITNDAPTVFPLGTTVVTWIATDASGNADTLTQNIVVEDLMAPVIAANNQTVTLDLTGNVLIDTTAINNTANDNCGVASVVYSQYAFNCSDVGANTITITVTDNSGNVTSQQITVTVLPSGVDDDFDGIDDACDDQIDTLSVVIPSGFTPNADNINDFFQVLGLESYASKTLEVFNRYGNQVYESTNYANQWDGTLLDTGEPLPDATYYYVLTLDGKLFKGYVYINRVK